MDTDKNSSNAWVALKDRMPPNEKCPMLLVTNNIEARDAYGHYSHVWLTYSVYGNSLIGFSCYPEPGDRRILNLTHWRYALPEEGS